MHLKDATFDLALALADDALVLAHRLSEWSGQGPTLEDDIALSNLGLDLIGQARAFYCYAAELEGKGRDEDDLAYFRDAGEFRNCLLVEQPNGDFAATIARQFLFATLMRDYYAALTQSTDVRLADVAGKAVKEMTYHVRHSGEWMVRLGDGTVESRERMVSALADLWTYTGEMFEVAASEAALVAAGIAPDRATLKPGWDVVVAQVLGQATLTIPKDGYMQTGGRSGRHSEHLGHMLTDMQVLARAHPEAKW
jgi:ring-1,2-phenylacetyl-CoA epoxidase subunit PaaC